MKREGTTYRAYAVWCSIVVHILVLVVARFLTVQPELVVPEFVTIDIQAHTRELPPASQAEDKQPVESKQDTGSRDAVSPSEPLPLPPVDVPAITPVEPAAMSELEMIDRVFFGDSLYAIVKAAPHLRSLVLRQMLVENVPTTDTLAVLRKQLAEAMLPYINMSEAERQARFHMKVFGTATNPMRPGPIPGNIPITDILRALIELLK